MNFVWIEEKGKEIFARFPKTRRLLKRIYQRTMFLISHDKTKCEGNVERVSPNNEYEYFYGYYDKSPWDIDNRYMISIKVKNAHKTADSTEIADVVVFDTFENNKEIKIGKTHCWNTQQACMAQWLGPDFNSKIIYNDFRDGRYISVLYDFTKKEEIRTYDMPIYDVAKNGQFALTLDFSRLHRLRKGYGYANIPETTRNEKSPNKTCIWKIDLKSGEISTVLKYTDLLNFETREEMKNAEHKVNHLMINPSGNRFMLLHRWFENKKKYTRLVTANIEGKELYNLSDDDFVSHCCWKNDNEILSFLRKKDTGNHYYLLKDKTKEYKMMWPRLNTDGHCTYSPNGEYIVTDSYPNRKRMACVYICSEQQQQPLRIAKFFSPFKYDNDVRCDLHPRWSRDGSQICVDSVHENKKELYKIKLASKDYPTLPQNYPKLIKGKYKIVYVITQCKNSGPMNQTLNIIKNMDRKLYQPIVVTLFDEDLGNSVVQKYLDAIPEFYCLHMGKIESIIKGKSKLYNILDKIEPDLIQGIGMPPYTLSLKYKKAVHLVTLRNYCYQDYPDKYGKILGTMLAFKDIKLIKKQIKKGETFVTCSESLSKIYKDKQRLNINYIRNGVDTSQYYRPTKQEKFEIRKKLNLPNNKIIAIYTGQVIDRKNQEEAIKGFINSKHNKNMILLILGNGKNLNSLRSKYNSNDNIKFTGTVTNVKEYLQASDFYVASSKSEGMPNGVLEAMGCGLPLILSDIEQHKEIFTQNSNIGFLYELGNIEMLTKSFDYMYEANIAELGNTSYESVMNNFTALKMAKEYQNLYNTLIKGAKNEKK